jgi:caffeoyl-CoA O-methyltransferase
VKRAMSAVTTSIVLAALVQAALAQPPARPAAGPDRDPGRFNPLMRLFDADRDGVLSKDEIAAAGKKLAGLDKNGDGKLTQEEFMEAMPAGRGRGPGGPGGPPPMGPMGPAGRGGAASAGSPDGQPLPKDDQEKRILEALQTMRGGPRYANVSPTDGRLLRLLAEAVGAKRIVEIGTSTGESATWLALALRKTGGHLFTHEIDQDRAKVAEKNFKTAGVDDLVTIVVGDAHETVKDHKEPIDVLFLDADKQGYIDYLEKLLPLVRPGGLIVAHNMNNRQSDPQFVKAITEDPNLETLILLKEGAGVSVTLKKR